jgi:ABC-2 type transport system permease protein
MDELVTFARLRAQVLRCTVLTFLRGSKLRLAVVTSAALVFWMLMFAMFLDVFHFLRRFGLAEFLSDYLFAFFYFALLIMMTISNAIISYTALFRSEETSFLLAMPVRVTNIYIYKAAESAVFSAWGMATMVVPMFLAYGLIQHSPWYFYLFAFAFSGVFMALPMELGAIAAIVVPLMIPKRRGPVLIGLAAAGILVAIIWGLSLVDTGHPRGWLTEAGLKRILDRIDFCRHWALPSFWVSEGMLVAARAVPSRAMFLLLLLTSNVLFVGMVTAWVGSKLYLRAWAKASAGDTRCALRAPGFVDRATEAILFPLPSRLRLLVLKDARIFRRDPAQWSQCLLFFGLLFLYIMNLPRFGFTELQPYWHSLVSVLNLGATCLTLSTLTSRFVFPQISLEGRRIWVLGMAPVRRSTILWGKFLFATAGSFVISGVLITLSDLTLGLSWWTVGIHLFVVLCVCCGLNGMAVGLGAVYPNMRSDSPSQIVSSFGGTLNLVSSITFILASVFLVAVPSHAQATGRLVGNDFLLCTAVCMSAEAVAAAFVCIVPMRMGIRAFEGMEF